jgi:hypothetical protein
MIEGILICFCYAFMLFHAFALILDEEISIDVATRKVTHWGHQTRKERIEALKWALCCAVVAGIVLWGWNYMAYSKAWLYVFAFSTIMYASVSISLLYSIYILKYNK